MSNRVPPNPLVVRQPFGLPSNQNLKGRPHRNRGLLEPKEPWLECIAPPRAVHLRDDACGRDHHDGDDDRQTHESVGVASARLVHRRWSRHANEAGRAPA